MKKIYLILLLVIMGLGGLYAMLAPKLRHKNTAKETATSSLTKATVSKPSINIANCCPTEDSLILGTWIAVDDPLSKWVFTKDGMCYTYYADTLSDVDTHRYRILSASDSPLCGIDVSSGTKVKYLEWTSINDPNDRMCFVIYGLTGEVLNVTLFRMGEFLIFRRPWSNFEP